jgi:PmbA protein
MMETAMADQPAPLDILASLLESAKRAGADSADAVMIESAHIAVAQRLGQREKLERAESRDIGLRVLIGKRQAMVSSTDLAPAALTEAAERAVAMARVAPEDPYCGLADAADIARDVPALDICDPVEPSAEALVERAAAAEDAARAVPGITNSEGAEAGWQRSHIALAATNGFARSYATSGSSVSAAVLAGDGTAMERDYDYASAVHAADLPDPAAIGRNAGNRAVKRLGARKMKTQQVPVVYDWRVAGGLLRHLVGAINGAAIARGTSFLKDRMGKMVFAPGIRVMDDPLRKRGLRSKPFDAEGLPTRARPLIEDGRLTTWLLDLASARKLGLASTGSAARGIGGPPQPSATNVWLEPGTATPEALIADIASGFFVTELIGMGVNAVTGDYSRGASGFWIENGAIAYPVSEMTIAGNLREMFARLVPASDLVFRYGTDAPTIRIDGMTVAGL